MYNVRNFWLYRLWRGYYKKYKLSRANDKLPLFNLNGYKGWAKVVNVYDGDTFRAVIYKNNMLMKFTFRPIGYDAPEMKPRLDTPQREQHILQAYQAKNKLETLFCFEQSLDTIPREWYKCFDTNSNGLIWIDCQKNDKYGRVLVTMYKTPENEISINSLMLSSGLVLPYDGKTKSTFVFEENQL